MGDINVNVSGGNANIGSINQGSGNEIYSASTQYSQQNIQNTLQGFNSNIKNQAVKENEPEIRILDLEKKLKILEDSISNKGLENKEAGSLLKTIRENYGWARPLIDDLVKAIPKLAFFL